MGDNKGFFYCHLMSPMSPNGKRILDAAKRIIWKFLNKPTMWNNA